MPISTIPEFSFVGGRLSLDFCNTVWERKKGSSLLDTEFPNLLVSYEKLLEWARLAGIISTDLLKSLGKRGEKNPRLAATALRKALTAREAIYQLLIESITSKSPSEKTLSEFNELISQQPQRMLVDRAGEFYGEWKTFPEDLAPFLHPVVEDAFTLLLSRDLDQVKVCKAEECGWIFLDISKSKRRRWCSMLDCGNRAKQRRFVARVK